MKQLTYSLIAIMLLCMGCATNRHKTLTWKNAAAFVEAAEDTSVKNFIPKAASKRDVPKHISFKEFKNDTAAYIQQSLENRKPYYIGRKFKVLLNDIELPVQFCILNANYLRSHGKVVYGQGGFFFSPYNSYFGNNRGKDSFLLYVRFAPPYADEEIIDEMMRRHDGRWWNKESCKIMEELIVTDIKYENWGTQ